MFKSVFKIFSCFIFVFTFLILLPSHALAFPKQTNYQGRAFDANNKFIGNGCWPVAIKIGRFSNRVVASTGTVGSYSQVSPGVEQELASSNILNTHPTKQCPVGQAYVENGLFNVILDLSSFNTSFMASTLPYYGVSIAFNKPSPSGADWSLWQPLVEDNWIYPNTQNNSPQLNYYLSSHDTGSNLTSWGLWTNHGFWANGGLGAPVIWLMGGDFSASVLTMTAAGSGAGWYSSIDASNTAVNNVPAGPRTLKINPSGGSTELSNRLNVVSQDTNRANIRPLVGNGDILISDDSGQEGRGITIQNGGNLKIGKELCLGGVCKNTWPGAPRMQVFNTPGASTFTVPSGVSQLLVEMWGSGAGGGGGFNECTNNGSVGGGDGGGGGGGAGAYGKSYIQVTPGQVLTIEVNTGGSGGAYGCGALGSNGGGGQRSRVSGTGIDIIANGGSAGTACSGNGCHGNAGLGGNSTAQFTIDGGDGSAAGTADGGNSPQGGQGAPGPIGSTRFNAKSPGGAGGGGIGPQNGSNGGNGRVVIYY